jgi:phosphomannomutase
LDAGVAVSIPPVLDPKVFKAYDVRGIYPAEIDEDGAYAIGRAFVEQFEPMRIAVGTDMRVSSPGLTEAVTDGAADAGADVLQLGLIGTEMLYFAVGDLGLTAASPSPPRTTRRSTRA